MPKGMLPYQRNMPFKCAPGGKLGDVKADCAC